MSPLFSVLIANYNNGEYLREAIESVLAQTYTDWEIILVDDKSTDSSREIYEEYRRDARFHFYYNDENRGCGFTKRRCAELANGALCGFLDPDDALHPEALETMVKAHAEHPECSLIYSTCFRYSGNRDGEMKVWDFVGAIPPELDILLYKTKIPGHFASYKTALYRKTEGINDFLKADVDGDLYLLLEEVGSVLFIPIPLYYYRINNSKSISISSQEAENRTYHYTLITNLDAICRRMGGPLYQKNEEAYLKKMRVLLRIYHRSMFYSRKRFMHYAIHYLKGMHFSPKAFSHLYKLMKDQG